MIRPLRFETARYGEYSKSGESVYDHPFLWGSKRTGPDLAREGGLRSDYWHYQHMIRPKDVSEGSIMPAYPWMNENALDLSMIEKKIGAMRTLGVPYEEGYEKQAKADALVQAEKVATSIVNELSGLVEGIDKEAKIKELKGKEIVALISYLQRLGTDIKVESIEEEK